MAHQQLTPKHFESKKKQCEPRQLSMSSDCSNGLFHRDDESNSACPVIKTTSESYLNHSSPPSPVVPNKRSYVQLQQKELPTGRPARKILRTSRYKACLADANRVVSIPCSGLMSNSIQTFSENDESSEVDFKTKYTEMKAQNLKLKRELQHLSTTKQLKKTDDAIQRYQKIRQERLESEAALCDLERIGSSHKKDQAFIKATMRHLFDGKLQTLMNQSICRKPTTFRGTSEKKSNKKMSPVKVGIIRQIFHERVISSKEDEAVRTSSDYFNSKAINALSQLKREISKHE